MVSRISEPSIEGFKPDFFGVENLEVLIPNRPWHPPWDIDDGVRARISEVAAMGCLFGDEDIMGVKFGS